MPSAEIVALLERLESVYPYGLEELKFEEFLLKKFSRNERISQIKSFFGRSKLDSREIDILLKLAKKEKLIAIRDPIDKKMGNVFYIKQAGLIVLDQYRVAKWTKFTTIALVFLTTTLIVLQAVSANTGVALLVAVLGLELVIFILIGVWSFTGPERSRRLFKEA